MFLKGTPNFTCSPLHDLRCHHVVEDSVFCRFIKGFAPPESCSGLGGMGTISVSPEDLCTVCLYQMSHIYLLPTSDKYVCIVFIIVVTFKEFSLNYGINSCGVVVFPTWGGGGTLPILELKLGTYGTRENEQNALHLLLCNLSNTSKLLAIS